MRKIVEYMSTLLLLLVVGTGCEEGNDNWKIITSIPEGTYITGDATIYSATATASSFVIAAPLENGEPAGAKITCFYTWLKKGGSFTILKVDKEGNQKSYGKGEVVSTVRESETTALAEGASAYTVAEDGLYYLIINNADNQMTLLPAKFGLIGDFNNWSGESAMTISYNEEGGVVVAELKDITLAANKGFKFRFSGDWGVKIPYQDQTAQVKTDMGNTSDPKEVKTLTDAFMDCKGGGENVQVSVPGVYDITLKLDLRSGTFSAKAVCTLEDTSVPLPTNMFVNTTDDWDNAQRLISVKDHDGMFWSICYFEEGDKVAFNTVMSEDGKFGIKNSEAVGKGDYEAGTNAVTISTAGYYCVNIIAKRSEDKKSLIYTVRLLEPRLYVIGDCANGTWSINDANIFTLSGDEFVTPVLTKGTFRACVRLTEDTSDVQWWQAEVNVKDGKIVYRGTGSDPDKYEIAAGEKVKMNFKTGNAAKE